MPWAKRLGGPGVSTGCPSRGATTRIANQPRGLSRGPASTRPRKPSASGTSSHHQPVTSVSTLIATTPVATVRAALSLTGLGKSKKAMPTIISLRLDRHNVL